MRRRKAIPLVGDLFRLSGTIISAPQHLSHQGIGLGWGATKRILLETARAELAEEGADGRRVGGMGWWNREANDLAERLARKIGPRLSQAQAAREAAALVNESIEDRQARAVADTVRRRLTGRGAVRKRSAKRRFLEKRPS